MKNNAVKKTCSVIAGVCATMAASAYGLESGDMLLRFGAAHVAPNSSTGNLWADGANTGLGDDLAKVESASALGVSFTYMFTPIVGLEILASSPFKHDIKAKGALSDLLGFDDFGSTKHLPPTISVQFYPMGASDSAWQPYVGLGVNYTWFHDEELSAQTEKALGVSDKDFKLKDSVGPAVTLGLDWFFAENWFANASVMWADINTEATIDNSALGDLKLTDIEVDPFVYRLNFGYRF